MGRYHISEGWSIEQKDNPDCVLVKFGESVVFYSRIEKDSVVFDSILEQLKTKKYMKIVTDTDIIKLSVPSKMNSI
jgi:hypothetical protein